MPSRALAMASRKTAKTGPAGGDLAGDELRFPLRRQQAWLLRSAPLDRAPDRRFTAAQPNSCPGRPTKPSETQHTSEYASTAQRSHGSTDRARRDDLITRRSRVQIPPPIGFRTDRQA